MGNQLAFDLVPERRQPSAAELARRQGVIEEKKKLRAMKGSGELNAQYREIARQAAREVCARDGDVDVDRVRFHLEAQGIELPWRPGWPGSIFTGAPDFEPTGKRVTSKHKGSKARKVDVWRRAAQSD